MPSTEVILTDNVPGLGAEADVVKVRRGYARNYLLPRGKAYEVTPAALRQLDTLKKKRAEREALELNESEELALRVRRVSFSEYRADAARPASLRKLFRAAANNCAHIHDAPSPRRLRPQGRARCRLE